MANIAAIRSVGASLGSYLDRAYGAAVFPANVTKPTCNFRAVSSGGLEDEDDPANGSAKVLIFLYHVSVDSHLRNSGRQAAPGMTPPLSIALHYLVTFWANSPDDEHLVLAWTMRQLQATSLLDTTILSSEAQWSPEDMVQLIPEELSTENMMRIWDTLKPDYRLSLGYVARVVRIDRATREQLIQTEPKPQLASNP